MNLSKAFLKKFSIFLKKRPADHPKMMVKITLCAYAQGIRSGRKIEDLVKEQYPHALAGA
jgi:transposase